MTGASEDTLVMLEMLIDAYKALKVKHPAHEMLRFATLHADEQGLTWNEGFMDRYYREGDHNFHIYARYTRDLDIARKGWSSLAGDVDDPQPI